MSHSWFRAWRVLALGALLVLALGRPAKAESPRLQLSFPRVHTAACEEVLLRVRAELVASGFEVTMTRLPPSSEAEGTPQEDPHVGSLAFGEPGPGLIEVSASAPALEGPIHQLADLNKPGVTPEVVAVRAVEALRAAMVQSWGRPDPEGELTLAPEVARFTHLALPPEQPGAAPAHVPAEPTPPLASSAPSDPKRVRFVLQAGPLLRIESSKASPAVGAELQLGAEWTWLRLGVLLDATFLPAQLNGTAGTVFIREFSAAGRAGVALEFARDWQWQGGLSFGLAGYTLTAEAEPGFVASSADKASALFQADTAIGYFFSPSAGPICGARVALLSDAPVLTSNGAELTKLGRPAVGITCGLQLRF